MRFEVRVEIEHVSGGWSWENNEVHADSRKEAEEIAAERYNRLLPGGDKMKVSWIKLKAPD